MHWVRFIVMMATSGLAAAPISDVGPPGAARHASAAERASQQVLLRPKAGHHPDFSGLLPSAKVRRVFNHLGGITVLRLPPSLSAETAAAILRASGEFDYAEPDGVLRLQATAPNDFRFPGGELWGLHNTGLYGGTPGADIKAPEAWDIRHDAPDIIVALVDSGVRQSHEDLAPNLWVNPREIPGNGIDDDDNGVADDIHGYNAYLQNGDPEDDLGHGTHVAGIIGAAGNNIVGVAGVAWKVQIMPTKFTDPDGNGTISDAIACIDYARLQGARIVNASWGSPDFGSLALRDAISRLRDAGILFITVAGNNHGDNDQVPYYPGAFASELDNIIVVTATDRLDQLAFFGNYGARTVHLGAPGAVIFSTWLGSDQDYQYYNGGSMAVAFVSGAAALVTAQFPTESHQQVKARILSTTDPLPTLAGKTVTGGRLNLWRALSGAPVAPPLPTVVISAAQLVITRTGSTNDPLPVNYTLQGAGATTTGSVVIPAGLMSVTISAISSDGHSSAVGNVTLALQPGNGYATPASNSGAITITNNP